MDANKMIEEMKKSFVSKYYAMDPETDFMIPTSDLLQNGMRVLFAEPDQRVNTLSIASQVGLFNKAMERNRWCKVSNLKRSGDTFAFVATYDDGTQRKRSAHIGEPWLVKLDSVDELQKKRNEVLALVDFISRHDESTCSCVPETLKARVTEDILQIFGMGVTK